MKRIFRLCSVLTLIVLAFALAATVQAQGGAPSDTTKDAIFADLSKRVGQTVTWRGNLVGRWSYEEIVVADNNLGCPLPGQAAPGQTRAWKFSVILDGLGTYDYRTTKDGNVILLCSGTGVGAPAVSATTPPVVAPSVVAPPAQPAVTGQTTTYQAPVIAYVGYDGNIYVTTMGINPGPTPLTGDALGGQDAGSVYYSVKKSYTGLQWSPDGSKLAFKSGKILYVASSGQAAIQLATNMGAQFNPVWSADGTEIAYAIATGQQTGDPSQMLALYQVQAVPAGGGQPRVVGTVTWGGGCGGGGWGPGTTLYFNEAGYEGNNQLLAWTTQGFLFTTNCTGVGLALTNFAGQKVWEQPKVGRAALSPDGKRVIALQFNQDPMAPTGIVLVDLATGALTPLQSQPGADQVAWSGDGASILYSTRTQLRTVQLTTASSVVPDMSGASYTVTLWSMPAAGGQSTQLFSQEGHVIGVIAASPTVALATFSFIESEATMVEQANAGAAPAVVYAAAPKVKIGVAALTPGTAGYPYFFDGNGGRPTFSRGAQFTAVPAALSVPTQPGGSVPGGATGDNPLGLKIGGRAVVPAGGNVNLRTAPAVASNNVLGIIRPGDFVVILAGPNVSNGQRWWQVRRESDGATGWVVDQVTNAKGQIENNIVPVN